MQVITNQEQKSIWLDAFLWHLCSWEKVTYMEKEKAVEAFYNQIKEKCTVFYQFTDEAYLFENAESLTMGDLPYYDNHMYYSDLYVMDWEWT